MSVIPQKMQDWTPAARHALLQLCNCKIKTRLNLAPATVFHPKRINESYDNAMTLRARDIWYKILFDDLRLVFYFYFYFYILYRIKMEEKY